MRRFERDDIGGRVKQAIVAGALALSAMMPWAQSAWAADPPKDPCEEVLKAPGTGAQSGALRESLAEQVMKNATNPLSGTTGPAGDYYLDPAAVEMLPPGGKRTLCWMLRYEKNLHNMNTRLAAYQYDFTYRCVPAKTGRAANITTDREQVQSFYNRMPSMREPRHGYPRGSAGWIQYYLWEVRDYTNSAEFKRARLMIDTVGKNLAAYEKEAQACLVAGAGTTTSQREYSVWLADKDVLVGQSDVLRATPTCRLKGWGLDCETTVGKALEKQGKELKRVETLYNTFDEARKVYCSEVRAAAQSPDSAPKVVPLTGGRDWTAKLSYSGERVSISNAPQCPSQ
jgi:hypothetical protein